MRVHSAIVLVIIGCLQPARSEEPHTFWGKTVEQWLAVYRDKASTEVQRRQALYALGGFGPEAKAALPHLIEARDMEGLIGIGGPAVPALRDLLNDPDDSVRGCAAQILGKIGPEARAAVPSLIRAIHRSDPAPKPNGLVREVVESLGEIGPAAKAAIPALNDLLDNAGDDDFDVVLALNRIGSSAGPEAAGCIPARRESGRGLSPILARSQGRRSGSRPACGPVRQTARGPHLRGDRPRADRAFRPRIDTGAHRGPEAA